MEFLHILHFNSVLYTGFVSLNRCQTVTPSFMHLFDKRKLHLSETAEETDPALICISACSRVVQWSRSASLLFREKVIHPSSGEDHLDTVHNNNSTNWPDGSGEGKLKEQVQKGHRYRTGWLIRAAFVEMSSSSSIFHSSVGPQLIASVTSQDVIRYQKPSGKRTRYRKSKIGRLRTSKFVFKANGQVGWHMCDGMMDNCTEGHTALDLSCKYGNDIVLEMQRSCSDHSIYMLPHHSNKILQIRRVG